ncbi:hypothetical protein GWK47_040430 [Chionoecetes opilio]|uniref:Uncharacterized protein n=1 Tax=Chionoecetes opilio TaxID=41210 RepID=A0A8J4YC25_CHIOP|nr:hypothetical protein GWK47_040430 [Chionoecetes opilio]
MNLNVCFMMSISGEEVSRCRLEGCQLVLKSSQLGLTLSWLTTEAGKQKLCGTSRLSNVKCDGSLHPVFIDSATEKALFSHAIPAWSCGASSSAPPVALVVSGCRTVLAAHWKLPGVCVAVCSMIQPILWTGILKVDHRSVITVVSKGTTISFGRNGYSSEHHTLVRVEEPHQDRLIWSTKSLPTVPVTSCAQQNMLLFSDGTLCWLCQVSFSEKSEIILRSSKLCINGIIRITNEEKIKMLSCDGRRYCCTWDILSGNNGTERWKQCVKDDNTEPRTVNDIMKAIDKCSKIIDMEGKTIQTLMLYIKQLSIAQRLLTDNKDIFIPTVKVEKSMENKGYLAIVQLHKTEVDVSLRGRWWTLCMVVSGITDKSVSTMKLTDEQLRSNVYQAMLPLPPLNFCTTSGHIEIQIYLMLERFTSAVLVCKVLACQAQVDILNFMGSECNLSTDSSKWNFGATKTINAIKTSDLKPTQGKNRIPFSKISVSFINSDRTLELVCRLFNLTVSKNSEMSKRNQTTLWYRDNRVDVECVEEDKKIVLQLKSSNSCVVLSLKAALERRVHELKQCVTRVTLPSSILREAHATYRLLNYEENHVKRVATASHLYHATSMLSSLIPLG